MQYVCTDRDFDMQTRTAVLQPRVCQIVVRLYVHCMVVVARPYYTGPKAVGDGGPKAIGDVTPQQVGAFQFIINSGPTARAKAAMHTNRAAMHELWESQVGAELWVIGKTVEALFNTVAAATVSE